MALGMLGTGHVTDSWEQCRQMREKIGQDLVTPLLLVLEASLPPNMLSLPHEAHGYTVYTCVRMHVCADHTYKSER